MAKWEGVRAARELEVPAIAREEVRATIRATAIARGKQERK